MRLYCVCLILLVRISSVTSICPICRSATETTLHALWGCSATKRVWKQLDLYQCLKSSFHDSFVSLSCSTFSSLSSYQQEQFAWVIWSLWHGRNDYVHGHMQKSDKSLLDGVFLLQNEFKEANNLVLPQPVCKRNISWTPLTGNRLKINVDAATLGSSGQVGIGVVVQNCRGELLGALACPVTNCWSVLSAKLLAICHALEFCLQAGFFNGAIIGDSMMAIKLIQQSTASLDENCFLVDDIKSLLTCYFDFSCSFVGRATNMVAHSLAKHAVHLVSFVSWLEVGPAWLDPLLQANMYSVAGSTFLWFSSFSWTRRLILIKVILEDVLLQTNLFFDVLNAYLDVFIPTQDPFPEP
nr:uncharacterized protein LOC125420970 [Ziziphus jujuba var. spinosa]